MEIGGRETGGGTLLLLLLLYRKSNTTGFHLMTILRIRSNHMGYRLGGLRGLRSSAETLISHWFMARGEWDGLELGRLPPRLQKCSLLPHTWRCTAGGSSKYRKVSRIPADFFLVLKFYFTINSEILLLPNTKLR